MKHQIFFLWRLLKINEISADANKTKKLDNNRFKLSNTEGKTTGTTSKIKIV
jgi:hypothetical protein